MKFETMAIKVNQPIGCFYLAKIPACVLRELAAADVRRIVDRENQTHGGIQRSRNKDRLKDIKQYIGMGDSSFPNSIILEASSDDVTVKNISAASGEIIGSDDLCLLIFQKRKDLFKVIDGQHRLYAFDEINCEGYELVVTILLDLPIEDQAYMFSTINFKQRPVDRSLVYDLYEEATIYSPYKDAHNVAKLLNRERDSPFFERVKLLGVDPRFEDEILYKAPLTQNAVVREILKLISKNPDVDRENARLGKAIEVSDSDRDNGLIFREFYARVEDWAIYAILRNYFSAFKRHFPELWDLQGDSLIPKTVGYGALMRLLVPIYQRGAQSGDVTENYFSSVFSVAAANYQKSEVRLNFEHFDRAGSVEPKVARFLLKLCEIEV